MATKQEVQRAAVKRYGKGAYLQCHKQSSSLAKRQQARDAVRDAKQRMEELAKLVKQHGTHTAGLVKAARFVVDTDGDKTALESLASALLLAEREQELCEDDKSAAAEYYDARQRGGNMYYQYKVLVVVDGPLRFGLVKHEADSLGEMLDLIRTGRQTAQSLAI